ncbi:hypothetical protein AGMMS49957_16490 [Synergistales bacterium]|nr:hypothetical protein AGMMS49957_16490 [Synergistales bacterium]
MILSLLINDEDAVSIEKYALSKKISVSELVRNVIMERMEDESDLRAYEKAVKEYRKNSIVYSLDEVEREL